MFGFFKKKETPRNVADKAPAAARDKLVAEAMQNARKAREEIGEETLDKIVEALKKREESVAMKQAREKIRNMDQDKLADGVRAFLDEA